MRKRRSSRILSLVMAIMIILPTTSLAGGAFGWEDFLQVKDIIENEYYKDMDESKLLEGATKGLFEYLDEYSEYYTEEEFKELEASLSGNQVGIGIYLTDRDGQVEVLAPVEGGAAHRAGIRSGDIIETVDNKDVDEMDIEKVIDMLIGEDGTYVNIVVRRGQRTLPFYIQREIMAVQAVNFEELDNKIGYIQIDQFVEGVGEEVELALNTFDKKGIRNIILDLRDNPGGYLNEALNVSNKIIPKGPVVHIKYKTGQKTYNSAAPFAQSKYNMVVMVNGGSASASEIVAGAVKDRNVGKILGTRTYGKSKVQEVIKLNRGGLKLTTAEYFTPNRISIGGKGISPDIDIKPEGDTIDTQLEEAIKVFQ